SQEQVDYSWQESQSKDLQGSSQAFSSSHLYPIDSCSHSSTPLWSPLTQVPAADQTRGVCVAHLIRDSGLNVKSPKIKVCAKIDAPMAAGLSQQPKHCGGEEKWVEVTLQGLGVLGDTQMQRWLLAFRTDSDAF
ncbi:uncharacterized protein V6R79_002082, partial [Siganus canaliculatus]